MQSKGEKMMKRHYIHIVMFCAVILAAVNSSLGVAEDCMSIVVTRQSKTEFRYIIFGNEVSNANKPEDTWRRVKVLLDESAFSEGALTRLFTLLSKRFPEPAWLEVQVYTNLKQT